MPDSLEILIRGIGIAFEKMKAQTDQERYVWIAFSSMLGYAYSFYPNELGEGDREYEFELAKLYGLYRIEAGRKSLNKGLFYFTL